MQINIANTTKQNVHFHYRLPEHARLYDVKVPVGGQEFVHRRDLSSAEVDAIEIQLRNGLGAVRADEVDRTKAFIGICYNIDKPVKAEVIERAVAMNDDVLNERGYEQRLNSAVAMSSALTPTDQEVQQQARPRSRFDSVEIVEDREDGEGMSEKFVMDKNPKEGRGGARRN
jgi:hypothetical protein